MAATDAPLDLQDEVHIFEETDSEWVPRGSELSIDPPAANFAIFAKKQLDYETRCQAAFWSVIDKDLNGISHCQFDYTNGRVTPRVSWSCYKLKRVRSAKDYEWK
ncbi:hypothetical protein BDW74DRAFT_178038 [Aspergillus multicolor]|uniref:uncharacterized protein n=1 Tax=Aspergillus multicolor TaxID=41759 RepID=UPI003CCCB25E